MRASIRFLEGEGVEKIPLKTTADSVQVVEHLTCKQMVLVRIQLPAHFFLKSYLLDTRICYQLLKMLLLSIQTTYGGKL